MNFTIFFIIYLFIYFRKSIGLLKKGRPHRPKLWHEQNTTCTRTENDKYIPNTKKKQKTKLNGKCPMEKRLLRSSREAPSHLEQQIRIFDPTTKPITWEIYYVPNMINNKHTNYRGVIINSWGRVHFFFSLYLFVFK